VFLRVPEGERNVQMLLLFGGKKRTQSQSKVHPPGRRPSEEERAAGPNSFQGALASHCHPLNKGQEFRSPTEVGGTKAPATSSDTSTADQVEWTLSSDTQAQGTREGTCMNLQRKPSADWEEF
jgi:hypothetical protein